MSDLGVITGEVSAVDAVHLVAALSGSDDVYLETTQYFPYFSFAGVCTLPSLFGKRQTNVRCLVDAVNGHGATADPFNIAYETGQEMQAIQTEISVEEACAAAHRAITHSLSRNFRVIARFDPVFEAPDIVYKKFWIVGDGHVRALVDSTDGSIHPLRVQAA